MKKLLCLLPLFFASFALADMGADGANIFNSDSKQVSVTSSTVTQIMTPDQFIVRSYVINPSTFSICLSTYAATVAVSTTTSPSIPSSTSGTIFSPDGPMYPWWGGMWATMCGASASNTPLTTTISVLRTK